MIKRIAAFAVFLAAISPWADATVCACPRQVLPDLYKNSTRVFLGEVVEIGLLTKAPVDGQEVTYFATVRPLEIFKGSSNADVRVTFKGKYATPSLPLSESDRRARATVLDPSFGERTLAIVASSCPTGMTEGKYYIFEKQGEPLQYQGMCSQRIVYESPGLLDEMRRLRDAR